MAIQHPDMSAPSPPLDDLLRVAIETMDDAVLVTEGDYIPQRRIAWVNRAFTEMTGYEAEEAVGRTPDLTIGKDTDPDALARIQAARSAKVPAREELLKYRKNGTPFWADVRITPVLDADGNASAYVCVMRDITEKKQLFARVLSEGRMAPLGAVVAHSAHEMARDVSTGAIQLRHAAGRFPEHAHVLTELATTAERVRRVIFDVSMFARDDEAIPASADVREVLAACENLALARARGRIRVVRELGDLPPVIADRTRLAQVFLNLLLNATQAIPEGRAGVITLRAYARVRQVHVEIMDDGIGVAEADLPRLFTPFFTTQGVRMGRGLGLYICRHILTSLGGRIAVESALARGTTVKIDLRASSTSTPEAPGSSPRSSQRR